jgi:phosphatidylinositol-3-phosphatase
VRLVGAVLAFTFLLTACGLEGTPAPLPHRTVPLSTAAAGSPAPSTFGRVAVVVMENHEYEQIIGDPRAPFLNHLAQKNALATNFFATSHPSLPNYIALLGGDTFGIHSNCASCHIAARNLVDQLEAAGISWKTYMQGVPGPCFRREGGRRYTRRHNPFSYFDTIDTDLARCAKVVPLTQLHQDIASNSVPRFVWITPDECNDMHSCPIDVGDRFLAHLVPRLLRALGPHGALFLTFDEGKTNRGCCGKAAGGRIVTIVAGPTARAGRYNQPLDHYSILRAIEDGFGLSRLRNAACPCTRSMNAMFRVPLTSRGG